MRQARLHQRLPLFRIIIHADTDCRIVEHGILRFCQLGRHITEFHIRNQPNLLNKVKQQIRIGKVKPRRTILVFLINMHIIIENAVKPKIGKANLLLRTAQLLLHRADQTVMRVADVHQLPPALPNRFSVLCLRQPNRFSDDGRRAVRTQACAVCILQKLLQPVRNIRFGRLYRICRLFQLLAVLARCAAVGFLEKVDERVVALEAVAVGNLGHRVCAFEVVDRMGQPQINQILGKCGPHILFEHTRDIAFRHIQPCCRLGQ